MRTLHVQLQPDIEPGLDEAALRELLAHLASNPLVEEFECVEGNDHSRYINFNYTSYDHGALWQALSKLLHESSGLARQLRASTIVACEGTRGWDNYLLLHHFNPSVSLDSADEL